MMQPNTKLNHYEVAHIAANWWYNELRGPQASLAAQAGALDDAIIQAANGLFDGLRQQEQRRIDDLSASLFRVHLERAILMDWDAWSSVSWNRSQDPRCTLSVDYQPDLLLGEALKFAGMPPNSMTLLPNKTTMWVSPHEISVSKGYAASVVQIWPEPSKERLAAQELEKSMRAPDA